MNGRTITQEANAQLLNQVKIRLPMLIVAAFFEFILTEFSALNRWVTVFNAGSKQELGDHYKR